VGQESGGQGVAGLVGDVAPEIKAGDPCPEPVAEPARGHRLAAVEVAQAGGEQRHDGSFFGCCLAPGVPVGEPREGRALPLDKPFIDCVGDADGLVVVADLRLVVPEHWQRVVSADALQSQVGHFTHATSCGEDRLPDVAQSGVVRVVRFGELPQGFLVGERASDLVREGTTGPGVHPAAAWQRRDESTIQTDPIGFAGYQCPAQHLPAGVEQRPAQRGGHQR
jgi:hypothetical protein